MLLRGSNSQMEKNLSEVSPSTNRCGLDMAANVGTYGKLCLHFAGSGHLSMVNAVKGIDLISI